MPYTTALSQQPFSNELCGVRQNDKKRIEFVSRNVYSHTDWRRHLLDPWSKIRRGLRRCLLEIWFRIYLTLRAFTFTCAIATGMLTSGFVPPQGLSCRSWEKLYFAIGWLVRYLLSWIFPLYSPEENLFISMLSKDLTVTTASTTEIMITQIGIYNKCDC